jgi:imidazolonepropionase-like amidohydrolase
MLFARAMILAALLGLSSCSSRVQQEVAPPPKVILGGTLIDGTGRPPIVNSIVIVEAGKVLVATASAGVKIPDQAVITNATGLYVTPTQTGSRLEFGAPADLLLLQANPLDNPLVLSNPMRVMKTGEWMNAGK